MGHQHKRRGGSRKGRSSGVSTSGGTGGSTQAVLDLQEKAGNKAVSQTLSSARRVYTREELLDGPLPPLEHPQYQKAVRLRVLRSQGKLQEPAQPSLFSRIWGSVPSLGSWSWSDPAEEEEEDLQAVGVSLGEGELEGEGGGSTIEKEYGEAEEEDEAQGILEQLAPNEVVITLASVGGGAKDTVLGDVSGSSTTSTGLDGTVTSESKGKAEGSYGSVEGSYKDVRGATGSSQKGKVEFSYARKDERKSGTLGWTVQGQSIEGDGTIESFAGLKSSGELSRSHDYAKGEGSLKLKAGALFGAGTEGKTKIRVKSGDQELGSYEGTFGLHIGIGGEFRYEAKWKGGTLTWGLGGKLALGPGVSYGYKVKLNTQGLLGAVGRGIWDWLSWLNEGATEEDFWL